MGLPTIVNCNGEGGVGGGGYVCRPPPEHSCTVRCDHTHYGYVSGGGAAPWGAGVPEVVVTEDLVSVGYAGGSKVDGNGGDVGVVIL